MNDFNMKHPTLKNNWALVLLAGLFIFSNGTVSAATEITPCAINVPWQPVLNSIFFVVIGSFAFHIASLTSGYSIFRELSWQFAALITGSVGLFLLLLSPIGYLIFMPTDYGVVPCPYTSGRLMSPELVEKLWTFDAMGPYILSTLGIGLMVGSATMLNARVLFWQWFRAKSGMLYPIYSYDHIWDVYLHSLKRHGHVTVTKRPVKSDGEQTPGNEQPISGKVVFFSEREEQRELLLETSDKNGISRTLVNGKDISSIKAPASSFSRDHQLIPTYSRAFYWLLVGVGAMLVASATHLTIKWIMASPTNTLSEFYPLIEASFEVFAIWALILSMHVIGRRYTKKRTSWRLHPIFVLVNIFLFFGVLTMLFDTPLHIKDAQEWLGQHELYEQFQVDVVLPSRSYLLITFMLLLFLGWLRSKRFGAKYKLSGLSNDLNDVFGRAVVDDVIEVIYLNYNWNSTKEWYEDAFDKQVEKIQRSGLGRNHPEALEEIKREFITIADGLKMRGDEINLVYWLKNYRLCKKHKFMRRAESHIEGQRTIFFWFFR